MASEAGTGSWASHLCGKDALPEALAVSPSAWGESDAVANNE